MISKENKEKQTFKVVQSYALHNVVGSGTFGKVYKSTHLKQSGDFAIKVVPVEKFKANPKLEECTLNEITILSNIPASPHIVRYIEMLKTANNFYFIYEFCNGGCLSTLLTKQGKLPEAKALKLFDQLLQAFKTLHAHNIMHRDVKPDNILFHQGQVKLGDFGFCKTLGQSNQMTGTMLGSPIYMAPQVLRGQTYASKADIWSLGVVLFEMLFGFCPFQSKCIASLITSLEEDDLKIPTHLNDISSQTYKLLTSMLCKDPNRRITWQALFALQTVPCQMTKSTSTQQDSLIQRSSTLSKTGATPLQFGAKKKACSASEANPSKPKTQFTRELRAQSSKSQLKCVTNIFNRQGKKSFNQKNSYNQVSLHKECIKGIGIAMNILNDQKQNSTSLLIYCLLKKIDYMLEDLKQQNDSMQWLNIIKSQQTLISSQITNTVPKLIQQGFTMADLLNPQILGKQKLKQIKGLTKQYTELYDFLGWPIPGRVF